MSKKTIILEEYFYNRTIYLEHELQTLQENCRYRPVSSVDCLELIIARERVSMLLEVSKDVRHILGLSEGLKTATYKIKQGGKK